MKNFTPTALKWTRNEIDSEWKMLSEAISDYLENDRSDQVEAIEEHLEKMGRFFQMIGAGSSYLLVREMGSLFRHIVAGNVTNKDEAYACFAQSCLQLPYILDYLATGSPDIPELMLPLLNELRKLTSEKKLRRIDVFCADHSLPFSFDASQFETVDVHNVVISLRSWREHSIGDLTETGNSLQQLAHQNVSSATQWTVWIMGLMCHAIKAQKLDYHVNIQFLFARLEKELSAAKNWKHYRLPPDLLSQVLYYSVYDASNFQPLKDIAKTFDLHVFSNEEKLKAQSILAGKNAQLLTTVCKTVKDELAVVKDSLDLFLRTQDMTRLNAQVQVLQQSSDTLRMVGLNDIANNVLKQSTVVMAISNGISAGIDDNLVRKQLLDIAHQLLVVDDLMDQHLKAFSPTSQHTGELFETLNREISISIAKVRNGMLDSQRATEIAQKTSKIDEMVTTLETIDGAFFAMGFTDLIPYIKSLKFFLENEYRIQLDQTPLEKIQAWADVLVAIEYYIEAEQDFLPTLENILNFAKTSVLLFDPSFNNENLSVENSDCTAENLVVLEPIQELSVTQEKTGAINSQNSVDLSIEVIQDDEQIVKENISSVVEERIQEEASTETALSEELVFDTVLHQNNFVFDVHSEEQPENIIILEDKKIQESAYQESAYDELVAKILQEADQVAQNIEVFKTEPLFLSPSVEKNGLTHPLNEQEIIVFDGASSDAVSDPHIKDIFAEELQEEILGLTEWLPMLTRNPNDRDTLYNVRKSFHSIKGSGRMVGAITLATMSWVIESTLNQVMDNKRPLSPTIFELIENGLEMFEKHYQVLNGNVQTWNYDQLSRWFDLVEEGSELHFSDLNQSIKSQDVLEPEEWKAEPVAFVSDVMPFVLESDASEVIYEDVSNSKRHQSETVLLDTFAPVLQIHENLENEGKNTLFEIISKTQVFNQELQEPNIIFEKEATQEATQEATVVLNKVDIVDDGVFVTGFNELNDEFKPLQEPLFVEKNGMLPDDVVAAHSTEDVHHPTSFEEPTFEAITPVAKQLAPSSFPAYTEWSLEPMETEFDTDENKSVFYSTSVLNDETVPVVSKESMPKEDTDEPIHHQLPLSAMEQIVEAAAQTSISTGETVAPEPESVVQQLFEISDLDLPDLSASYMGRQTDWKIHLGYLYSLQEQIAQVGMELALVNTLSVPDKIVLQKYFEDLSKRQKEGLHELRRTTIENERNLIKARSENSKIVPPVPQRKPIAQPIPPRSKTSRNDNPQSGYTEPLTFENDMNVFTSEKVSFWERLKKIFK